MPDGDFVTIPNMTTQEGAPIFLNRFYDIEVPGAGEQQWITVCRCDTAESVAMIMQSILRNSKYPPKTIKVTVFDA